MRTRLLTTYKLLGIIILFSVFFACDPNGDPRDNMYEHKLQIENVSNSDITLLAYDTYDEHHKRNLNEIILKHSLNISNESSGPVIRTKSYSHRIDYAVYFYDISVDSIVIKFNNNKGYISTVKPNDRNEYRINNDKWIESKSSLLSVLEKDLRKEGDVYIYTITQEDYENAYELP